MHMWLIKRKRGRDSFVLLGVLLNLHAVLDQNSNKHSVARAG